MKRKKTKIIDLKEKTNKQETKLTKKLSQKNKTMVFRRTVK